MSEYTIKLGGKDVDISDWARWVAQDNDGDWWEYDRRPLNDTTGWYPANFDYLHRSISNKNKRPADCTQQLYRIERKQ